MKKNEMIIAHSLHIDIAKAIANTIIERQSLGNHDHAQQQHPITVGDLSSLIEAQKAPTLNPSTLSRHIISAFNNRKNAYYKDLDRETTLIRIVAADGSLFAHNIYSNLEQAGISITDSTINECVRLTLRNLEKALNQCYQKILVTTSLYLGCEIQFETWDYFKQHVRAPKDRNTTDFSYAGSKNLWSEGVLPLIKIVKESRDHVNTYDFLLQSMQQLHRKALRKEQQQKEADTKRLSALAASARDQVALRQAAATSYNPQNKKRPAQYSSGAAPEVMTHPQLKLAAATRTENKVSTHSSLKARSATEAFGQTLSSHSKKTVSPSHPEQKSATNHPASGAASTSSTYHKKIMTSAPLTSKSRGLKSKQSPSKPKGYDVFINRSILLDNLHLFTEHSIDSMCDQLRHLLDLHTESSSASGLEFQGNSTILRRFIERVYDNRKPLRFTIIELNAVDIKDPDETGSPSGSLVSASSHPRDQIISSLKHDFRSILGSCHPSTLNQCVQLILDMLPSPAVETQIGRIIRACYISTKSYSHRQQKSRPQNSFKQNTCIKWAMRYIANEVDIYSSYFRLHNSDREITYRPLANSVSAKLSPHDYAVVSTMKGWRNKEHNILSALNHLVCSPHFNVETNQIQKEYSSPLFKESSHHALNRFVAFLLQEKNINAFFDKTIREWVETIFFNNTIIYSSPSSLSLWRNILDNLYRACDRKSSSNGKLFLSLQAALFFRPEPSGTRTSAAAAERKSQQDVSGAASRPLVIEKNSLSLEEEQAKFLFFISLGKNPYNFIAPFLPPKLPTPSTSTTQFLRRPHSQPSSYLEGTLQGSQVKLASLLVESKEQERTSSRPKEGTQTASTAVSLMI